jgi:hypothetical protein
MLSPAQDDCALKSLGGQVGTGNGWYYRKEGMSQPQTRFEKVVSCFSTEIQEQRLAGGLECCEDIQYRRTKLISAYQGDSSTFLTDIDACCPWTVIEACCWSAYSKGAAPSSNPDRRG